MKPQCNTSAECLRELARVMEQFGITKAVDAVSSQYVKYEDYAGGWESDMAGFDNPEDWQFAIAEVEGKPVFLYDTLFDAKGDKCQAIAQSDTLSRRVLVEYCDKSKYWFAQSELYWNPPRPKTVMVELLVKDAETYARNRWIDSTHQRTADACKKALEQIK